MNRNRTRFALGVKCDAFGASGSAAEPAARAAGVRASRSSSASQPKPAADCFSRSRRERTGVKRPQKCMKTHLVEQLAGNVHCTVVFITRADKVASSSAYFV